MFELLKFRWRQPRLELLGDPKENCGEIMAPYVVTWIAPKRSLKALHSFHELRRLPYASIVGEHIPNVGCRVKTNPPAHNLHVTSSRPNIL